MKFGARILKTGIAVVLALLVVQLLGLTPGLIAGIAAVNALQPNVHRSFSQTWNQFRGNIIGAVAAIVMVLLFESNLIVVGLTIILVLSILMFFNLQSVSGLAVVTVIAIMDEPLGAEMTTGDFLQTAAIRFSLVMIGVLCALVINLLIIPPKYEDKLYNHSVVITNDIFKLIRLELNGASDAITIRKDVKALDQRVNKLETLYDWYKEERPYFRKSKVGDLRSKILFKHVVILTRDAYIVLESLNQLENDYKYLSEDFINRIRYEMDQLMAYHEQVLLKISEKIPPETSEYYQDNLYHYENTLIEHFLEDYHELINEDVRLKYENILNSITAINEYHHSIRQADRITNSYFKYHETDEELSITEETLD